MFFNLAIVIKRLFESQKNEHVNYNKKYNILITIYDKLSLLVVSCQSVNE